MDRIQVTLYGVEQQNAPDHINVTRVAIAISLGIPQDDITIDVYRESPPNEELENGKYAMHIDLPPIHQDKAVELEERLIRVFPTYEQIKVTS